MKTLLLEPFSGIAGDMTVAALLDLGVPFAAIREPLAGLPLSGWRMDAEEVRRGSFRATRFVVSIEERHPHRGLEDVRRIVTGGGLPERVVRRAMTAFLGLAEAEGAAHGKSPEEIHFHEVGAVDAIVDVVGAALGLEHLGVERVLTGRVRVGTGETECRHGRIPVPAPATLRLLEGLPVLLAEGEGETTTPTGAALLHAWAEPVGGLRELTPGPTGFGAGTREDTALPNVLRATLCAEGGAGGRDAVEEISANVDDATPETLAFAAERLMEAGALDAWITPAVMKKGRPGAVLSALAPPERAERVAEAMLRETTSFGVRRSSRSRRVLERRHEAVATPWGPVRVKVGALDGETVTRSPEYEDCARLAREHGVSLRAVYEAARRGGPGS